MADVKFQVGDIVRLASGGPKMTVARVMSGDEEQIKCIWFDITEDASGVTFIRNGEAPLEHMFTAKALIKTS